MSTALRLWYSIFSSTNREKFFFPFCKINNIIVLVNIKKVMGRILICYRSYTTLPVFPSFLWQNINHARCVFLFFLEKHTCIDHIRRREIFCNQSEHFSFLHIFLAMFTNDYSIEIEYIRVEFAFFICSMNVDNGNGIERNI